MLCVFLGAHTVPHFVNWETSRGYGFGSQNSEQSKRIVSLVVEIEMLVQGGQRLLKNKILKKEKKSSPKMLVQIF